MISHSALFVNDNIKLLMLEEITMHGDVVDGVAKFAKCRGLVPTAASGGCSNGVGQSFAMGESGLTSSPMAA